MTSNKLQTVALPHSLLSVAVGSMRQKKKVSVIIFQLRETFASSPPRDGASKHI